MLCVYACACHHLYYSMGLIKFVLECLYELLPYIMKFKSV
jgi:hypothetical protein